MPSIIDFTHLSRTGVVCCISIFGVFINGWMFTDGYIAAIRNLGLSRFRFVLYTLSDGNREGSRHTFRVADKKKFLSDIGSCK